MGRTAEEDTTREITPDDSLILASIAATGVGVLSLIGVFTAPVGLCVGAIAGLIILGAKYCKERTRILEERVEAGVGVPEETVAPYLAGCIFGYNIANGGKGWISFLERRCCG
jgi:hypothetical protein